MNSKLEFARGDVIAKKYEVVDLLDESPLGLTYRVKHLASSKYVRLLMIRPSIANRDAKEQLIQAFKDAKNAKHENLIKLGELGEHMGLAYVTMEDFEGTTLREFIQEHKIQGTPFDVKEAAQITIQVLEGVEAAAGSGFTFRALRPEYVLVHTRRTGPRKQNFVATVKLVGIGFWDLVPTATLTEDEFSRGEAQYIAPELKGFEPKATERSDVYSSGVMFYEMVVGTAPVGTFQLPKTKRPDVPDHVNNVAELALAHAPEDRYQSARDFIMDIQRIFDGSAMENSGRSINLVTPLLIVGLMLALMVVGFVAIALYWWSPDLEKVALANDANARNEVVQVVKESMPTPDANKQVLARHPANMAYIPEGPFLSGAMEIERLDRRNSISQPGELVNARVDVKGFMIDLFEYPNLQGANPQLKFTAVQAEDACKTVGKRLCTALEWEKACKGPAMFAYSYGDTYDESFCGNGLDEPYPSGTEAKCTSGWGPYDMSGNFREWTSTPQEGGSTDRVEVKGGVRAVPEKGTRCAFSKDERRTFADKSIGFRCCRDVNAPMFVPPPEGEGDKDDKKPKPPQ